MVSAASIINVAIFGATGSIGQNTLDVIARHPDHFAVFALAAQRNVALLKQQCLQFKPRFAALVDMQAAEQLRKELRIENCNTEVLAGVNALDQLAAHPDVHTVMAAIVGARRIEFRIGGGACRQTDSIGQQGITGDVGPVIHECRAQRQCAAVAHRQ